MNDAPPMTKQVLFISYDGLTDPLGQSQILPYFMALSAKGHQITILSAEKPERYAQSSADVKSKVDAAGIDWQFVSYKNKIPILSSLQTISNLKRKALQLIKIKKFELYHCRSIIPAMIGFSVQKKLAIPLVYDIRGFWADERVDGNLWNLKNPLFRIIYKFVKQKEKLAYESANYVVTLTEAAKKVLEQNFKIKKEKIVIVPCMADLNHFNKENVDFKLRQEIIQNKGLKDKLIIGYCGSLGTRYMLEEMLQFFKHIKALNENALFYIVTKSDTMELSKLIEKYQLQDAVIFDGAPYSKIPTYLSVIDLALYFIYPGNSGKAVSPTKQAEFLGMGIPIVTNDEIGDSREIIQANHVGLVIEDFTEKTLKCEAHKVVDLLELKNEEIRGVAERFFSLSKGVETYHNLYQKI